MAFGQRVILVLGGPGAGKGTQGALLSQSLAVPHVSSGDLVRQRATSSNRPVADDAVGRGELLPDEEVAQLVFGRLAQPDAAGGVALDGFPRTIEQVHLLDEWLRERGREASAALFLDVPHDELLPRLTHRGSISSRTDDRAEVARHRLEVFDAELPPILDEYARRGILRRIDGSGAPEVVHQRVLRALAL
jgi:adenylate kinase